MVVVARVLVLCLCQAHAAKMWWGRGTQVLGFLPSRHISAGGGRRLRTGVTTTSPRVEAAVFDVGLSEVADSTTPFDWWRQWYPVALERDLDASVPTKVTLLGRDLVLWKDGNTKQWRCFIDSCPHRLAPLSEGRIEPKTGHLQCAYHGWEFNEEGKCTKIPQLDPDGPTTALGSRRACAQALPAQAAQGMVWVWADGSDEGIKASLSTPPNIMEGVDQRSMSYLVVCRDMPYGVDTLLENGIGKCWRQPDFVGDVLLTPKCSITDPSHLPFAHHNIISNRNQAAYIDIRVDNITVKGFDSSEFYPKKPSNGRRPVFGESEGNPPQKAAITVPQSLHFRPPCLLFQTINVTQVMNRIPLLSKRERLIHIVTYAIPTAPGRSRVIYRFLRNYMLSPVPFLRWPPQWLEHLRILRVLDSDTVFLHGQERELALARARGDDELDKAYFMPTPADGSVRALRRWFAKFGAPKWLVPGLQGAPLPPAERDRRVLLDRYNSHTKSCKVCSGALRSIRRLRHAIGFLSVMAFYLGLLGQSVYTRLSGGFLTVLGITGVVLIRSFEELFHYQDWNHGKN